MNKTNEMLTYEELDGDVFQCIEQLPNLSYSSLVELLADESAIDLSFLMETEKLPLPAILPKEIQPRSRKRCAFATCDKNARYKGFCTQHGGRRYCSEPDCKRSPMLCARL
ncbi:hypothetical protein THRCLA_08897 [Thraustotheca clavata]|uniref:WRKY19-like zinc finger domain-containing protein n=1 Tax=Thraustotheca clavata TaxID=74557 RepID=A0A1V9Z113_9STRA|nr:hypothetical protein THRCLA_08897 [Thraustotheca clavata]